MRREQFWCVGRVLVPNFNSIGSGIPERQVAENYHLPLTRGIAGGGPSHELGS